MDPYRPDPAAGGVEAEIEGFRRRIAALTRENEALRQAAERMAVAETLVEASPLPLVAFDPDGVVTLWNPAAERLFGWAKEEAVGMRVPFVPAERQVEFQEHRERALRGEAFTEPELHRRKADGSPVVVSVSTAPLRRPDGTIHGILSILTDVTARTAADDSLERLSMAVAQTDESIVITDPSGVMLYVNPAFERATGFSRLELLGRNPQILRSEPDEGESSGELRETLARGGTWRGTFINRRKDGTLYEEDAVISPVRDRSGRIAHCVWVSRSPVSPEREEASPGGGATESSGNLTGGVAHDFNNLLTAISGYCDLLLHRVPEYSDLRKDVEQIRKAGDRAAGLTQQLLALSRRQRLRVKEPEPPAAGTQSTDHPAAEGLDSMIPSHGAETVLLVEDEEVVRLPAREILRRCGYTVLEARHGREALLLSEAHRGTIHLMLTDAGMSRMGGEELADRMRRLRPDTRVLFMSGCAAGDVAHDGTPENGTAYLRKPFTAESLSMKVREILDAP
jgi:PAS domain S-box-containing protein